MAGRSACPPRCSSLSALSTPTASPGGYIRSSPLSTRRRSTNVIVNTITLYDDVCYTMSASRDLRAPRGWSDLPSASTGAWPWPRRARRSRTYGPCWGITMPTLLYLPRQPREGPRGRPRRHALRCAVFSEVGADLTGTGGSGDRAPPAHAPAGVELSVVARATGPRCSSNSSRPAGLTEAAVLFATDAGLGVLVTLAPPPAFTVGRLDRGLGREVTSADASCAGATRGRWYISSLLCSESIHTSQVLRAARCGDALRAKQR